MSVFIRHMAASINPVSMQISC